MDKKRKIVYRTNHKRMLEFDDEIKKASMMRFGEHMKEENMHVHNPPPFSLERKGIKQQMEEADVKHYYDLPSIEEFTKMVKELMKEADERFNNTRK